MLSDKKRVCVLWISVFIMMHISIYFGGHFYVYYSFGYALFYIPGLVALFHMFFAGFRLLEKRRVITVLSVTFCVGALLGSYYLCDNTDLFMKSKDDIPQFQIAEIIKGEGIQDPTLLNYNTVDIGVYNVCNIIPVGKYYYIPNVLLPEALEEQKQVIDEAQVDYVVVRGSVVSSDNYEQIYETHGVFEGYNYPYTLYQKK